MFPIKILKNNFIYFHHITELKNKNSHIFIQHYFNTILFLRKILENYCKFIGDICTFFIKNMLISKLGQYQRLQLSKYLILAHCTSHLLTENRE